MTDPFKFHRHLDGVAAHDVTFVKAKDRSYGSSWKKRGGVGAFMMLARKWDRLEEMLSRAPTSTYDLFEIIDREGQSTAEGADGTVLAEVRDLRRYLLLVEAEMIERGAVAAPPPPGHPAPLTEENHYSPRVGDPEPEEDT